MVSEKLSSESFAVSIVAAAIIGVLAWHGALWQVALSTLVPTIALEQPSRSRSAAVLGTYFSASSLPLIQISSRYFGLSYLAGIGIWLTASGLVCIPWLLLWSKESTDVFWTVPTAFALSIVPPFGFFGWASPLLAGGALFPGFGWIGIALMIAIPVLVRQRKTLAAVLIGTTSLVANANARLVSTPFEWVPLKEVTDDHDDDFSKMEALQQRILAQPGRYVVTPEGTVGKWNEAKSLFWEETAACLRKTGRSAFLGASMSQSDGRLMNGVLVIGANGPVFFRQRVAVPLAMWNPLRIDSHFAPCADCPEILQLREQRVAVLICYEQLLVWPFLTSALKNPTVILGLASNSWTTDTSVIRAQKLSLRSWARLFRLPLVSAVTN